LLRAAVIVYIYRPRQSRVRKIAERRYGVMSVDRVIVIYVECSMVNVRSVAWLIRNESRCRDGRAAGVRNCRTNQSATKCQSCKPIPELRSELLFFPFFLPSDNPRAQRSGECNERALSMLRDLRLSSAIALFRALVGFETLAITTRRRAGHLSASVLLAGYCNRPSREQPRFFRRVEINVEKGGKGGRRTTYGCTRIRTKRTLVRDGLQALIDAK
jgi:hypothetical protein